MHPLRRNWLLPAIALLLGWAAAASHGQQIAVLGNNTPIAPGDNSPSGSDHTDFGSVDLGAGVIDRTFTIQNPGNGTLQIGVPQRLGGNAGEFTIIPPYPALVLPGQTRTTFTIRFIPGFLGPRSTTVRILNNTSTTPFFDFAIRGTGTVPEPEIVVLGNNLEIGNGDPIPRTADHTDFGAADIDGGLVTRTFTIRNVGDANLQVGDMEMFGGNTSDFFFSAPASNTVFPGFETSFDVTFDPSTTGLHTTTVRIANTDIDASPFQFTIQGTGTTFAPEVALRRGEVAIAAGDDTPSVEDGTKFPSVGLNDGSVPREFTITNTGTSGLTILTIDTVGGNAGDFTISGPGPGPLAPGISAPFEVRFNPSGFGLRTTTLRITSNDPDTPSYEVALLGAGGKFELLRIERDGDDAIIHFTTNPDTTVNDYIYSIRHGTSLDSLNTFTSFSLPGGTTELYRHVGGFTGPINFWQIREDTIP